MYQVLYRKYRPRVFSDVVGQEHITTTLAKEIEEGKTAHAYLFTGSRGTGKTTCAKILSKAVNCLNPQNGNPCNECEICRGLDAGTILDVVEIDAASNNGVDSIRDIRDEISFTPAACQYRVYIIDEVHMLSIGAFNALLKTLEEPPAHVKFILATTEVHKLPVTIVSRCQRFDFRRVSPQAMTGRMKDIAEMEGFTADDEALSLIARLADGGMRDALSLLDQCAGRSRAITAETVCSVAGMTGRDHLFALAEAVCGKDSAKALEIINDLYATSCDMERLCSDLIGHMRNLMIVKTVRSASEILVCTAEELAQYRAQSEKFTLENILYCISRLQESMANIKRGVNRRTEMEMAIIRLSTPSLSADTEGLLRRVADIELRLRSGHVAVSSPAPAAEAAIAPERVNQETPAAPEERPVTEENPAQENTPAQGDAESSIDWAEVLLELTKTNMPLWGILNGSSAVISGDYVLISSDNPTLSSFIKTGRNARDVKEAIFRVTGRKYRLGIRNAAAEQENPQQEHKAEDPLENLIGRAKDMGINIDIRN
ncbi:MAG: DNA polymerase III subunit gamma/tau [Oscillospiraceae bacterium]|nr:DNA polymerase III subunit gamma/tau [Oscillospiraceae bacterium]